MIPPISPPDPLSPRSPETQVQAAPWDNFVMKKPIHVAIPHLWDLPNTMVADQIRVPASQLMNIRSAELVLLSFLDLPDYPSVFPFCIQLQKARFSELCRALRGAVGTFLMQEHTKKKDGIPIE